MKLKELKEIVDTYPWNEYEVLISAVKTDRKGNVTEKTDLGSIGATLTNSKKKTVSFVLDSSLAAEENRDKDGEKELEPGVQMPGGKTDVLS